MSLAIEGKLTRKGQVLAWRHAPLVAHDPLTAWQGLLAARNLQETDSFFAPALANLPDPFLMKNMDKAAPRVADAIINRESIHVFGDFDCDGVSGTSILVEALRAAGAKVSYSIPHRVDDGHGIGVEPVEQAVAEGVRLGLSVDTGTTCHAACARARHLGLDFIITDHHLPEETLPEAFALLNPSQKDCGFAEGVLCGTGVAFFLLMATWRCLAERNQRPEYDLKKLLDRVAMATVADVMMLRGVNRILVHFGLLQLRDKPSLGMAALLQMSRVKKNRISTEAIGFHLAPCINAAGRMSHGEDAMALLCSQDSAAAAELAVVLDGLNQSRRKVEADTYKQAIDKLKPYSEEGNPSFPLAVFDRDWHAGVVGLVAGRLARQYGRPAAVGFVDQNAHIRVSLRGRQGFHIGDLLHACAESLLGFGGHAGAGGGTIKAGCWPAFVECFQREIEAQQQQGSSQDALKIDGVIGLHTLHYGLASRLQKFEPIGYGNPACVWLLHEVCVTDVKKLKGGVYRLQLSRGAAFAQAVVFGGAVFEADLQPGMMVSLIGAVKPDDFRGGESVQFVVEDVLVDAAIAN